jgi:hypothetical protein
MVKNSVLTYEEKVAQVEETTVNAFVCQDQRLPSWFDKGGWGIYRYLGQTHQISEQKTCSKDICCVSWFLSSSTEQVL